MDFQQVVQRRQMTRDFTRDPIPKAVVERLIDNAVRAPSAGFTQGWEFLVLRGHDETERFWSATFTHERRATFWWPGLFNAPVIIVPLAHEQAYRDRYAQADKAVDDQREFWPVPYWHIDCAFAALLIQLTAIDEGLGCLFFGIFSDQNEPFRRAFCIPEAFTPIGAIAIGHPAPEQRPSGSLARGRRPLTDVVHRGTW